MRNAYTLIHSCILDAEWATQSVSIFGSGQPIYIACCLRQQVLSWLVRRNLVSLACHDKSVLSYDALILPCLAYHARLMLHGRSSPVHLMACLAWMVLHGRYLEPSCKSLHHQACHGMYTYLVMHLGFTAVLCLGCPVMPRILSSVSVLSHLPYPSYYDCSASALSSHTCLVLHILSCASDACSTVSVLYCPILLWL